MKRVAVLLALAGCAFTQKHPGVTVGLATGSIGFFACEISVERVGTCSAIAGATGLVLGGLTGLITLFADTKAHELPSEEEEYKRIDTRDDEPPGLPSDAGVTTPVTSPADAAAD